jgi:DNA-binding transcriptional MocR family regulator
VKFAEWYRGGTPVSGYILPGETQVCYGGVSLGMLTMVEAAHRLGVSVDTVKRRIQKGELKGHQQPRPQGFVWLVEMPEESNQPGSNPTDTPVDTTVSTGELRRLEEMVQFLKDELAARDAQLESWKQEAEAHRDQLQAKDRQIEQLHVLLQQAQTALPSPRDNRSWWQRLWRRG